LDPEITVGQLRNGQVLAGRYRIETIIGRGGMAEVYRGVDVRLVRPIAIKVLRGHYQSDPVVSARFEEEARAAAMLSHPNVVAVYDAGEDGDTAFIVMELVTGETLADRIARGPLDEAAVRRTGGEVLDALAAAHARGVLHRDIKPANVLLTDDGIAKVADFGIAKALHPTPGGHEPTAMSLVLGTPSYLAPERAQGHPATVRSDLWSVGVLLYESLTGQKPFEGETPIAVAFAALEGRYEPLLECRPDVDPALATLVDCALQVDPAMRFASADEMAGALRTPLADTSVSLGPLPFDPEATSVLEAAPRTMVLGEAAGAAAGLPAGYGTAAMSGGGRGPIAHDTGTGYESFAGDGSPRRHGLAILGVVALLLLVGVGGFLLVAGLRAGTTGPKHIANTTSTTSSKSATSSTTSPASSTTTPQSSTTTRPSTSSTTTTQPSTTTTTTLPPTTSSSTSSTSTSPTTSSTSSTTPTSTGDTSTPTTSAAR
jgi:serine/threonine protein kinase